MYKVGMEVKVEFRAVVTDVIDSIKNVRVTYEIDGKYVDTYIPFEYLTIINDNKGE